MKIDRLTPALGAEVTGVDLSRLLDQSALDATNDALYKALIDHQVIVIRNAAIEPLAMAELGAGFGELGARHHRYVTHPDSDDVVILEWKDDDEPDAAEWHSDMTYRREPPFASILKAVVVPPSGGDTLFASMYSVFESLDPGLQRDLGELEAVHDMGTFRTPAYREGGIDGLEKALIDAGNAVHPIVAHHPVTGRPYLNVSESFTTFVIGLSAPQSNRLLMMLFEAINRPQHHVRIRWEPNTLAMWDNRATQHYAVADYLPHRRVMHRVAVSTDRRA